MNPLAGKRVLLTGASGFIGARIAECLTRAYQVQVHALIRRFGTVGAARVGRLSGVRMFYGDICDAKAVRRAAEGCSHIVHCATGTMGSAQEQEAATVDGTRHVLDAARNVQAERLVYFSSASVHGPARSGVIREDAPLVGDFPYARTKIQAEALVSQYTLTHGLPAVILRPTCVWGPFSPNWTVGAAGLISRGIAFLPREGRGAANAVYIDHLVDAVWLSLTHPGAVGQRLLINDDEPGTWGDLYGGYAKHLGVALAFAGEPPGIAQMLGISLYNLGVVLRHAASGKTRLGIRTLREIYTQVPIAQQTVSLFPQAAKQRIKRYAAQQELIVDAAAPPQQAPAGFLAYTPIPRPTRELYGSSGRYSNERAKQVLGWKPRLSFTEAMARTCQWLSYAGYAR